MSAEAFGTAAPVVPKKSKTPYTFVVVHDTDEGIKVSEFPTRTDARKFIGSIGAEKFITGYRATEVLKLKTTVSL